MCYYFIYLITLILLFLILILLWREEKKGRRGIIQGLANKYWILKERRRYIRFNEELKMRYNIINKPENTMVTKTSNISKKGLCFIAYERLDIRSYLDLEIDLPEFSKPVKTIGQVAWVKELQNQDKDGRRLFYTGIKIHKIQPESEARLLVHITKLTSFKKVL